MDAEFKITIDTREQKPWIFDGIQTHVAGLPTGDYSLFGYHDRICIERKSLHDLFNTLGGGRDRFVRELERMQSMESAHVIIEGEWSTIALNPPERSKLSVASVVGSIAAWSVRYPRIHWWTLPGRACGEAMCVKLLRAFWKGEQIRGLQQAQSQRQGSNVSVRGGSISGSGSTVVATSQLSVRFGSSLEWSMCYVVVTRL